MSQKDCFGIGGCINCVILLMFMFNGCMYQGFQGDMFVFVLFVNGVYFVVCSFKYYCLCGIVMVDVVELNVVVQFEIGLYMVLNVCVIEIELYQGFVVISVNVELMFENDKYVINQKFLCFMLVGFYYKIFMWLCNMWLKYEEKICEVVGFGKVFEVFDVDCYDKCYVYCDVFVVGGGLLGFVVVYVVVMVGVCVIFVDDQCEFGGSLLLCCVEIDVKFVL